MRALCLLGISVLLRPAFVVESAASPEPETQKPRHEMLLWYRQPGRRWLEGLPLGNDTMGAMVFGGVSQERIALNEGTFWSGRPRDYDNLEARRYFGQIRNGSITGPRARGGLEVGMQWRARKLASAQIRGIVSGPRRVRSGEKTVTVTLQAGRTLNLNADLTGGDDARDQR